MLALPTNLFPHVITGRERESRQVWERPPSRFCWPKRTAVPSQHRRGRTGSSETERRGDRKCTETNSGATARGTCWFPPHEVETLSVVEMLVRIWGITLYTIVSYFSEPCCSLGHCYSQSNIKVTFVFLRFGQLKVFWFQFFWLLVHHQILCKELQTKCVNWPVPPTLHIFSEQHRYNTRNTENKLFTSKE